jgi:cell division topological specificity factor
MSILRKLLGRRPQPSSHVAKERLKLVLVYDRLGVNPDVLESLKADIIAVISKHIDIDQNGLEVKVTRGDKADTLVANIPVRRVKR